MSCNRNKKHRCNGEQHCSLLHVTTLDMCPVPALRPLSCTGPMLLPHYITLNALLTTGNDTVAFLPRCLMRNWENWCDFQMAKKYDITLCHSDTDHMCDRRKRQTNGYIKDNLCNGPRSIDSFTFSAPVIWNSLLRHLWSPSTSRRQFSGEVKTHLFKQGPTCS